MDKYQEAVAFIKSLHNNVPGIGVVLGTGLGRLIDKVDIETTIPYTDIPNFPVSTVESHKGNLVFGKLKGKSIVLMQGRFHFYEGYTMQQVVFPIRVMKLLGIKNLLLSNASGGINTSYRKGDLVLIDDHINLQTANPLIGKNEDTLGPRFPDMSRPYDSSLNSVIRSSAESLGLPIHKGVYAAVNGPNLETRAEYRFLKTIGADLVGMSTVPEVIAANHMSLPCAVVSVVTDECDPDNLKPVKIEEIIAIAAKADEKLAALFTSVIENID